MAENRELALVLKLVADQFQSELKKSGGLLGDFQKLIGDWKVQLTAFGGALLAIAKSTANFGEEALKGAQKAGQTVETFTALAYAAKQADIDQQQLIMGLKALSQNMVEASRNTGDGALIFSRLGISAVDATGKLRTTDAVLLDLADVFQKSADGPGKMAAAVQLLSKAGVDFIPFLNMGRQGITALMAEADRLGVVLRQKDAEAANEFNDAIKRLESSTRGLSMEVGRSLIPPLTNFMDVVTSLIVKVRELNSETGTVGQNLKNWSDSFGQTGIGQGLMDLFTGLGFGHRKGEGTLPREQFWFNLLGMQPPGSGVLAAGSQGDGGEPKPDIGMGPDPKKLQEDYRLYITGLTSMGEELLKKKREAYQLYITGLTSAGEQYLEKIKGTGDDAVKLFQENQKEIAKDRDILIENERAWISYGEKLGASTDFMLQHRLDLVRLELGKELNLNQDQAGRLLIAWQNHDAELAQSVLARSNKTAAEIETIQLRTLEKYKTTINELSGDFFEGWAAGLRKYAMDQSMFGLAADMSRRFFQTTEQGIQKFLFDSAEGRLTRLRDISKSILGIINQLFSQMAAQLLTKQFANAFAGAGTGGGTFFSALFNGSSFEGASGAANAAARGAANPGLFGPGFAGGGRFTVPGTGGTDRTAVGFWATPGETVDIRTPGQSGNGVTVIVNNYGNNEVQTSAQRGPDGRQMIYVTVTQAVRRAIGAGEFDRDLNSQFGLRRQGAF